MEVGIVDFEIVHAIVELLEGDRQSGFDLVDLARDVLLEAFEAAFEHVDAFGGELYLTAKVFGDDAGLTLRVGELRVRVVCCFCEPFGGMTLCFCEEFVGVADCLIEALVGVTLCFCEAVVRVALCFVKALIRMAPQAFDACVYLREARVVRVEACVDR
ncbi:MAG TPA: hypothetical protein VJ032_04750, partial [Thermoanaerobaculia bacterium]|nr:hypothetical protein [Thermoanaerobaculia bacterium]